MKNLGALMNGKPMPKKVCILISTNVVYKHVKAIEL